jgi:hypothetical protein
MTPWDEDEKINQTYRDFWTQRAMWTEVLAGRTSREEIFERITVIVETMLL